MRVLVIASLLLACKEDAHPGAAGPIIDVHLHTPLLEGTPTDPANEKTHTDMIAALKKHDVVAVMLSGPQPFLDAWKDLGGPRLLRGVMFPCPDGMVPISNLPCFADGAAFPSIDWLRAEHTAGRLAYLGEVTTQYAGMSVDDPAMEPYYSLAEELDIPVAIHMGPGPPGGAAYTTCSSASGKGRLPRCPLSFRMRLGDPMLLEPVLLRHPKMRVLVAHAGWPYEDNMIALLYAHPQVFVETAVLQRAMPQAGYHAYLRRLVEAGFVDRILFGSDAHRSPETLVAGIEAIQSASFLTAEQRRAILHDNAVRFLRLAPAAKTP